MHLLYNNGDTHHICLLPLGSFKALLVAYPDTKGYLEKEAESFHDFSHTTVARLAVTCGARVNFCFVFDDFCFVFVLPFYCFVSVSF